MHKILTTTLFFSVSLLVNADEFKLENPYLQLGVGIGLKNGDSAPFAFKFAGGFDLSSRFAVEGGGVSLVEILDTEYDIFYLSLVVKQTLTEEMSLAGKVGITSWDTTSAPLFGPTTEDSGTSGMAGIELKYDFHENTAAILSAEYFGGTSTLPITFGLRYTF